MRGQAARVGEEVSECHAVLVLTREGSEVLLQGPVEIEESFVDSEHDPCGQRDNLGE
jgi:hypothetical protein